MRILVILLLATGALAQQSATIDVNVLEIEVAVVDRAGKTVEGLTKDDFEVVIGRKTVPISNFYSVRRGVIGDEPARAEQAAPAPEPVTMALPTSVVIFFDDLRLSQTSKARAIEAVERFVRENVGASTSAMIVRSGGVLDVRTRPTERPGTLLAELERMKHEPVVTAFDSDRVALFRAIDELLTGVNDGPHGPPVEADQVFRQIVAYGEREWRSAKMSASALREVVKVVAGFEGRKVLLYVSEGLPMTPAADIADYWVKVTHRMQDAPEMTRFDLSRDAKELARAAEAANVTIYAFDPGGVRTFDPGNIQTMTVTQGQFDRSLSRETLQGGARFVSAETGGRFITNDNNLENALAVVAEQFTTYYNLGVKAPASTRMMQVDVRVKNRKDVRVLTARHRRPISREERVERGVRSRLYSRKSENPLGAVITLDTPLVVQGKCYVPLTVSAPEKPAAAPVLQLAFAMLDGQLQESALQKGMTPRGGANKAKMMLRVLPGKYVVSLAVTDEALGETTYVQHDVDATNCR